MFGGALPPHCQNKITMTRSLFYRAPGRFSPECPPRAMSNFLHVTLTKNAIFSDFGRLDGAGALDPRCLYSGSGRFRGGIERFCKKKSSRRRNFAFARELLWLHQVKFQIRRKSRYRILDLESKNFKNVKNHGFLKCFVLHENYAA